MSPACGGCTASFIGPKTVYDESLTLALDVVSGEIARWFEAKDTSHLRLYSYTIPNYDWYNTERWDTEMPKGRFLHCGSMQIKAYSIYRRSVHRCKGVQQFRHWLSCFVLHWVSRMRGGVTSRVMLEPMSRTTECIVPSQYAFNDVF